MNVKAILDIDLVEGDALVVRLADGIGNRMTAYRQGCKTGSHRKIRRPRVPHRRENDRITWLVQRQ